MPKSARSCTTHSDEALGWYRVVRVVSVQLTLLSLVENLHWNDAFFELGLRHRREPDARNQRFDLLSYPDRIVLTSRLAMGFPPCDYCLEQLDFCGFQCRTLNDAVDDVDRTLLERLGFQYIPRVVNYEAEACVDHVGFIELNASVEQHADVGAC